MTCQLLLNRIRTPDGTVLTSWDRHDIQSHLDANGEWYMVDGGTDYVRGSVNNEPADDLRVYLTDDHEANRMACHWGTYGPNGDQPLRWVALADMETEHIEAVLREIRLHPWRENLFREELAHRNSSEKTHAH